MKKIFTNKSKLQCVIDDGGVTFYGPQQEVYMPYGCLDSLKMSLLGVLQAKAAAQFCSFAVDHKDRAEMKEALKFAQEAMKNAPEEAVQIIDLTKAKADAQVPRDLSAEEQLKRYKAMFIQGVISKEEYDAKKRLLQ